MRSVAVEVLLCRDRDGEHEVICVLPDLHRISKESLLDVVAGDGDLGPLRIIVPDLEQGEECYGCQHEYGAHRATARIERLFAIEVELHALPEHIERGGRPPELVTGRNLPSLHHLSKWF